LQYSIHMFMLRAGPWRRMFPELQYKFMIASALNECIGHEEFGGRKFLITGYLLTNRRIYIVCKTRFTAIESILDLFYRKIKRAIRHDLRRRNWLPGYSIAERSKEIAGINEEELFEKFRLTNDWLIQLITGHDVALGYYDPKLEKLKKIIQHEQFCSAIDYSGGESPVIISKPHPNEKKRKKQKK